MKKAVLIIGGSLCLALGVLGIFLPILPTTPFLILASACFLRSSQRLYRWITGHRVFGPYISNYLKYRAVSKRAKTVSLLSLWGVILTTIIFFVDGAAVRILLLLVAAAVSLYLLSIKTLTTQMTEGEGNSSPSDLSNEP